MFIRRCFPCSFDRLNLLLFILISFSLKQNKENGILNSYRILYLGYKNEMGQKQNGPAVNYQGWFKAFQSLGFHTDGVFFDELSAMEIKEKLLLKIDELK